MSVFKKVALKKSARQTENSILKKSIYNYLDTRVGKDNYVKNKNHGNIYSQRGRPDLEIIYKGNTYYFELKDPRGVLSTAQEAMIAKYLDAGTPMHVVDTLAGFKTIWEKIEKGESK